MALPSPESCDVKPARISGQVYALLWFLGLCGAIFSLIELQRGQLLGLGEFIAIALAIATILQQLAVYADLHLIEDAPEIAASDYPQWINKPSERTLRFLIMICLLFGVGKIGDVVTPIARYIQCVEARDLVISFLDSRGNESHLAQALFVKGSLGVFAFLSAWNVCALMYRIKEGPSADEEFKDRVHRVVVTCRILSFVALSFISFIYWFFVFIRSPWTSDLAEILILIYVVLVAIVLILRYQRSREWCEAKITALS